MAPSMPSWLPQMLNVNGEWDAVIKNLYAVFDVDFRKAGCSLEGLRLFWDRSLVEKPYEEGFWHLITKMDDTSRDRLFDPRRAERLPWCKPTLGNCRDTAVKMWNYKGGYRRIRTFVWLEPWDYVIVLEKRRQKKGEVFFLLTAYYVEGDSSRRSLNAKYQTRIP